VKQVVADVFVYHSLYGQKTEKPALMMKIPAFVETGVNF
jgi:hypothetical protein